MKKITLLKAFFIISIFVSCSSDIDDNATDTTIISKTITYVPEFANFDTKTVGYYDSQNRKILDSVFDNNEMFLRKIITNWTSQTTTSSTYDVSNALTRSQVDEFDASGRLLETTSYDAAGNITFKNTFSYDDINQTVTKYGVVGSVSTPNTIFTLNNLGVIYQEESLSSGDIRYLEFQDGKPIRMVYPDIDPASYPTYTYYPTIKPENLRLTNIRINNIALKLGLEHITYNWNYFYNTVADYYQVQMSFNENNYPLSAKYTFLPNPSLSETFYYY